MTDAISRLDKLEEYHALYPEGSAHHADLVRTDLGRLLYDNFAWMRDVIRAAEQQALARRARHEAVTTDELVDAKRASAAASTELDRLFGYLPYAEKKPRATKGVKNAGRGG